MIKILSTPLLALVLCALSFNAFALKTDSDQPIDITADQLEMNEAKQISTYTGKVTLKQGSLNITADMLILYFDDDNALNYMEMMGKPARIKQKNEQNKLMHGSANRIVYRDKDSLLTLYTDAEFSSGNEFISSDFIEIKTDNNRIKAGKNNTKNRVHIKIMPRIKTAQ